jgi:hypothetical protein
LYHRVYEDERREEARMHEREIDKVAAAHAVAYADDGSLDLVAKVVDHEEEVARVVVP